MNTNHLLDCGSFYLRGAIQPNLNGQISFGGFSGGRPILAISPYNPTTTTLQSNTLDPAAGEVSYINNFSGEGTVEYLLPTPDITQRLGIANVDGFANPLLIQAPVGSQIQWTDGTLHDSILSSGNSADNISLTAVSDKLWAVTFAGESGSSTWTPSS